MVSVPGFLLRRLYVKGSLRATDDGLAFDLKNSLGSGFANGMQPLTVDGQEVPMENTTFTVGGKSLSFADVSPEVPFTLAMNRTTTVAATGVVVAPGRAHHRHGVRGAGTRRYAIRLHRQPERRLAACALNGGESM